MTQGIDRVPDSLGYLVINEEGAVLCSGGELENDERTADILLNMVRAANTMSVSPELNASTKRISVMWDTFMYMITVSNHRVYVSKRRHITPELVMA